MGKAVRALIVDDSAFMRHTLGNLLGSDPDIEVVDTARDGIDALEKLGLLDVDIVTLDVEMPRLDGLATLERIMRERPLPVVMVSSFTRQGADATIRALALGAVDFVCKPSGSISLDMHSVREELLVKVKHAAKVRPSRPRAAEAAAEPRTKEKSWAEKPGSGLVRVVAIGSSTGGPKALHEVLPRFGKGFPVPIVIVQHMPPGFTRSLAEHLDQVSPLTVSEAQNGDVLSPGRAFVAPGDFHLTVRRGGVIELNQGPAVHGVRPSVDVALESLADAYGASCLAVILTGMGSDGAQGALRIKTAGGHVLAEHESTCVVYGMPRSAVENGAADRAVPLFQMASAIEQVVRHGREIDASPMPPRKGAT